MEISEIKCKFYMQDMKVKKLMWAKTDKL